MMRWQLAMRFSLALATIAGLPALAAHMAGPSIAVTPVSDDWAYASTGNGLEYVTGVSVRAGADHLFLARFLPDGTLDPAFGPGGRVLARLDAQSEGRDVQQQTDGKLLVAGTYLLAQREMLVARFNADGSPDIGFGSAGIFRIRFGTNSIGRSISIQPDGKILAAGECTDEITGQREFLVVRLTAAGTLDSSYGEAGARRIRLGTDLGSARIVRALPDGTALVVGERYLSNCCGPLLEMYRLLANGAVDASFGQPNRNGQAAFGPSGSFLNAMSVGPNGTIWAAGGSHPARAPTQYFSAYKLNGNGILDGSFAPPNGYWLGLPCPATSLFSDVEAYAMAVTSDKLLLAGICVGKIALARLNLNGTPDVSFGNAGMVSDPVVAGELTAVAVQPNGGIVAVGNSRASILRARYDSAGARDTSYGTGGATFTHLFDRSYGGDFDGDGRSDLLYRNASTGQVHRLLMNGFALSSSAPAHSEPNLAWRVVGEGDFTSDGIADLLWRNESNGHIHVMPFNASGLPMAGKVLYAEPNISWKIVATPDLDGDGKADIVWWNSNTGQVHAILVNNLTVSAQGAVYTEPNLDWRIVASGDFAGSGKSNQLLWRNASTGQVYLMTVNVTGSTFGYTGQMIYTEPDLAWKILAAPDLNGDRRSDILWHNDVTGQVYAMLMNGPAIASQGHVYAEPNLAWKIVAQGDYNGDGRSDILYRNESTGQVYMMLMNGLAIASAQMVYTEPNLAWKLLGPYEFSR